RPTLPPQIGPSRLPVSAAERPRRAGAGAAAPPNLAYARPPSGVSINPDREPDAEPGAVDGVDRRFAAGRGCRPAGLRRRRRRGSIRQPDEPAPTTRLGGRVS